MQHLMRKKTMNLMMRMMMMMISLMMMMPFLMMTLMPLMMRTLMMMNTCNAKLELLPTNGSVTVIVSLLKPFFNLLS